MQKTILTFGLISGVLVSLMMCATIPLAGRIGFDKSEFVGYTTIVLSFLVVFFGIRSYRDNAGGFVTFGKAFGIGLCITLITCVFYVATWEVLYFNFLPGFMDNYGAYLVQKAKASGASPATIAAQLAQVNRYKELYNNVFYNAGITFLEPFPIGLVVTLISAAVLRKNRQPQAAVATA